MLRALALPGDALWTPVPLDPRALPAHPWLPAPALRSGALPARGALVPWAVVPGLPASRPRPAPCPELPLVDALRRAPRPALDVQRRVSHRRFGAEVAAALGDAPPGSAWLASVSALERHLATGAGAAGWVLKLPFSAGGEGLVRGGSGGEPARARLAALFVRHGALLFEPWEERLADLGACGWIDGSGAVHAAGRHAQHTTGAGGFRGVLVPPPGRAPAGLDAAADAALAEAFRAAGAALVAAGFRGPFGVDAYLCRRHGSRALRRLVELNPRLGFGHLAHALAERARAARALPADAGLRLALAGPDHPPPASAQVLVQPVDGAGAWAFTESALG